MSKWGNSLFAGKDKPAPDPDAEAKKKAKAKRDSERIKRQDEERGGTVESCLKPKEKESGMKRIFAGDHDLGEWEVSEHESENLLTFAQLPLIHAHTEGGVTLAMTALPNIIEAFGLRRSDRDFLHQQLAAHLSTLMDLEKTQKGEER